MRRLILILLVLALLALPAAAMDVTQEQAEQFGLDELERGVPDSAKEWMGELSPDEAVDFPEAVGSIFESALLESGPIWRTAARLMLRVLLIVVLCQMTMTLTEEQGNRAVALAGALAITACCGSDFSALMGLGREALDEISSFPIFSCR